MYDSPNEEDDDSIPAQKSGVGGSTYRSSFVPTNYEAVPLHRQQEDPLLPFYAKAREEAEAEVVSGIVMR